MKPYVFLYQQSNREKTAGLYELYFDINSKKKMNNRKRNVTQRTFISDIIAVEFKRKKVHSKSSPGIDCICEP